MLMTNVVVKIDADGTAVCGETRTRNIDRRLRTMLYRGGDKAIPQNVWLDNGLLDDGDKRVVLVVDDAAGHEPVNEAATKLVAKFSKLGDRLKIHGNAVVIARRDFQYVSLTGEQTARVLAAIREGE